MSLQDELNVTWKIKGLLLVRHHLLLSFSIKWTSDLKFNYLVKFEYLLIRFPKDLIQFSLLSHALSFMHIKICYIIYLQKKTKL